MRSQLNYPFPEASLEGVPLEIAKGVHWCRHGLPFALDHINTWLVEGQSGSVIIDTGIHDETTQNNWRTILATKKLSSNIEKIVVTHFHPDHIGNASWLSGEMRASVWMTHSEFITAHALIARVKNQTTESVGELFRQHGLPETQIDSVSAKGDHYEKLVPSIPESFRRIRDNDELDLGGTTWTAMIGTGHSPEHLSLFNPQQNLLISGDMLLPKITTNVAVWPHSPDGNPLEEFLLSIRRYLSLPESTLVLPSHGLPFVGIKSRVKELLAHHEDRLGKVLSSCKEPKTAFDILPTLFDRKLDAYQMFFAMGEAIAHLNYLMWEGKLRKHTVDTKRGVVNSFSTNRN